jgi:hypothetical protein
MSSSGLFISKNLQKFFRCGRGKLLDEFLQSGFARQPIKKRRLRHPGAAAGLFSLTAAPADTIKRVPDDGCPFEDRRMVSPSDHEA